MQDFKLTVTPATAVANTLAVQPAEPLWKRVPTSDDDGRRLSDFMMLIPKLRTWPQVRQQQAVGEIQWVFEHYRHAVVFADLNLRLNVLWVSVKPIPGICLELVEAVHARVPEAVLVGSQVEAMIGEQRRRRRR